MSLRTETRRVTVGDVAIEATENGVVLIVAGVRYDPQRTKVIGDLLLSQRLGELAREDWIVDYFDEAHTPKGPKPAREIQVGDYVQVPEDASDGVDHSKEWWTVTTARTSGCRTLLGFGEYGPDKIRFSVVVDADYPVKWGVLR